MTDGELPESHPRYESLRTRERLVAGVDAGLTSRQGLIAQGRGEAFDYLLGERTIDSARRAARAAAAHLLEAEHAVLSVNGNVAALCPAAMVELAAASGARLEVNLFHRTDERVARIVDRLETHGAEEVLGRDPDGQIPGLEHDRALVDSEGIGRADVVLVPLEDGDRAAALAAMGKTELVVDLNPQSRSARHATVPIVDNIVRAIPTIRQAVEELTGASESELEKLIERFDPAAALTDAERVIRTASDEEH